MFTLEDFEELKLKEKELSDRIITINKEMHEAWEKYYRNRARYQRFLKRKNPVSELSPFTARPHTSRALYRTLEDKIDKKARLQHNFDDIQYLIKTIEEGNY